MHSMQDLVACTSASAERYSSSFCSYRPQNDDRQRGDEKKKKKPEPVKKKEVPAAPVFQPPNTVWGSKSSATVSLQQIQMEQTQVQQRGTDVG